MKNPQLQLAMNTEAPIDVVWNLMTDFDGYAQWNPFVVRAEASTPVAIGAALRLTAQMPIGFRTRTRHVVTECVPPTRGDAKLTYVVVGAITWLVGGIRSQHLTSIGDGECRYSSMESFSGPLRHWAPASQVEEGVLRHAHSLKKAAEKRARLTQVKRHGAVL